jgi:hypothetical protein
VNRARLAVQAARASLEATGEAVESAAQRLSLAEGRYVVENPKVVAELLAAGVVFSELYATAAWTSFCRALFASAEFRYLN